MTSTSHAAAPVAWLLCVLAVLASLVVAPGARATTVTEPTTPATDGALDPTAPARPAVPPSDAPLRSGFTPEGVATATVPGPTPDPPTITAAGAVLFDPADGVILAGVEPRVARRMASTTKIMTVLVALEAVESGQVPPELTVSAFAAETGRLPGVATLGLNEGDVVDVRAILAAELLRSGNDGAVALAEHVAGSEPAYVAQMNQRSVSLGLEDTAFLDSSGLTDDPAHHATPLDLALLGHEAMAHPDFAEWAGATTLTVEPFGVLDNRNEMLAAYPGTTGIKTGFTSLAGLSLVASAERDGRQLYAVVLGSEDRVADTTALFDHGFEAYARPVPLRTGDTPATYRTAAGDVALSVAEDLTRTVGRGAEVSVVTRLAPDAALPFAPGTPLGEAVLIVDGEEVDRTALLADDALPAAPSTADTPTDEGGAATVETPGAALADALRGLARLGERRVPVSL